MYELVFMSALFSAKAKTNGLDTVRILRIAPPRIVQIKLFLSLWQLVCHLDFMSRIDLIWRIMTLLTNRIRGLLHYFDDIVVYVDVSWIDRQVLAVVDLHHWDVVHFIWSTLRCQQV